MKLQDAKTKLRRYCSTRAVLMQMEAAGERVPWQWLRDVDREIAMAERMITLHRTLGRVNQ